MRIVIQRVRKASVRVEEREVASIGVGLVSLVGFSAQDEPVTGGGQPTEPGHPPKAGDRPTEAIQRMAQRLIRLRMFDDAAGRLNRSLEDIQGELLLIPQVTLTASLQKGTRPSFHTAAPAETARKLFDAFLEAVRALYPRVHTGAFQAHMIVSLENDGPVTFILEDPASR